MRNFQSIHFRGYKSFPEDTFALIERIKNVNVIIGKNNSGKSSVIDIVRLINSSEKKEKNNINVNQVDIGFQIDEEAVDSGFRKHVSGGGIPGGSTHHNYGLKFIDNILRVTVSDNSKRKWSASEYENDFIIPSAKGHWDKCAIHVGQKLSINAFRRLSAERNIIPEKATNKLGISDDGLGATNVISRYINLENMDENLIEHELLQALNIIMYPDAEYQRIQAQVIETDEDDGEDIWEVFLHERNVGRFPLSQSGSGLKTIILVLLNLLVIPKLKEYQGKDIVFAFEEIENNLHPALQRRIFDYIYDYALSKDVCVFITTHSHVAINAFFSKQKAQIHHVKKDNNKSTIHEISGHLDKAGILEDLDVKASDLLQSNGIIWVEGPSDRIYIKKWLEIFGEKEFEEGKHYQFLYYGGKILSHFSSDMDSREQEKYINILTTNRNAVIVMDSDRKRPKEHLRETKIRIRSEFEKNKMFCWITKGREIENYLSADAVGKAFGKFTKKGCDSYGSFSEYIKLQFKMKNSNKVIIASKITEHIDYSNAKVLDVEEKMSKLIKAIEEWNKGII